MREPFHRGFGTDLIHSRHVVDRIADQREIIDDTLRLDAEFFLDARDIERLVRHRVDERYLGIDELRHILVAGRNHGAHAAQRRLARKRPDHIVGLDPVHDQKRPADRTDDFVQRFYLRGKIIRHRRTIRFIFSVDFVAESLTLGVEDAGAVIGCYVFVQLAQHVQHAINRAGRLALAVAQIRHCMKSAIQVRRGVDQ